MAKKEKKSGFWKEFKEFAVKGNMFDMAIGVIIGAVFKDLVTSFTDNIIMPIVNIFTGSIDFSQWKIKLLRFALGRGYSYDEVNNQIRRFAQ